VWFLTLHAQRSQSGFGPSPLCFSDIDAWSRLSGTKLHGWELEVILDLDGIFLTEISKKKPGVKKT